MSKLPIRRQTRRSVSVRGATYARLRAQSDASGESVSAIVERAIAALLASRDTPGHAGTRDLGTSAAAASREPAGSSGKQQPLPSVAKDAHQRLTASSAPTVPAGSEPSPVERNRNSTRCPSAATHAPSPTIARASASVLEVRPLRPVNVSELQAAQDVGAKVGRAAPPGPARGEKRTLPPALRQLDPFTLPR